MVIMTNNIKNNGKLIETGRLRKGKGKIQKEFALSELNDFMVAEGELLLRIPYMISGMKFILDEIETSAELMKYLYPKTKRDNPIRACLMVGGLSRTSIGHMDSHDYIVDNIDDIREDNYHSRMREIARRNGPNRAS